jgi:hypothetical protein
MSAPPTAADRPACWSALLFALTILTAGCALDDKGANVSGKGADAADPDGSVTAAMAGRWLARWGGGACRR